MSIVVSKYSTSLMKLTGLCKLEERAYGQERLHTVLGVKSPDGFVVGAET